MCRALISKRTTEALALASKWIEQERKPIRKLLVHRKRSTCCSFQGKVCTKMWLDPPLTRTLRPCCSSVTGAKTIDCAPAILAQQLKLGYHLFSTMDSAKDSQMRWLILFYLLSGCHGRPHEGFTGSNRMRGNLQR